MARKDTANWTGLRTLQSCKLTSGEGSSCSLGHIDLGLSARQHSGTSMSGAATSQQQDQQHKFKQDAGSCVLSTFTVIIQQ